MYTALDLEIRAALKPAIPLLTGKAQKVKLYVHDQGLRGDFGVSSFLKVITGYHTK